MDIASAVYLVVIIIFSAIVHEVMHGVAADALGDKTARYAGRLTLNPIPHIDPVGSVLLPLGLALIGSPIFFGWAKPVPYNPYNLRVDGLFRRFSEAIVAGAGPASNAVIAIVAALCIRSHLFGEAGAALFIVVLVNVMLCLFNLVPIPPLDGSKVLEAFFPRSLQYGYARWRHKMEYNPAIGMALLLVILVVAGSFFTQFIYVIASALSGI